MVKHHNFKTERLCTQSIVAQGLTDKHVVYVNTIIQSISGCLSHRGKNKIQSNQSKCKLYQNVTKYSKLDWSVGS